MVWKPKEKELTPEEAVALAKKELRPFWHGSAPLLAGVAHGGRVTAHPLDPEFLKRPWLIVFIDPTDFSGESVFLHIREFVKRYQQHDLGFLIVLSPTFQFLRDANSVEHLLRKHQITVPVAVDADLMLSRAFGAASLPRVILLSEGRFAIERSGSEWVKDLELDIQKFLRVKDPGLPLLPVFRSAEKLNSDAGRADFGRGRGVDFGSPGFGPPAGAFATAKFAGARPPILPSGRYHLSGTWIQDADRIATSDPAAVLTFHCPSEGLALVAQTLARTREPAKIVVEAGGVPVMDVFGGMDLGFDDEGQSVVRVDDPRIYEALIHLPAKSREITLRFPTADRVATAIFGVRFCQR
jgi:hypothetical protein